MTILEIIVLLPIVAAIAIAVGAPGRITAILASGLILLCTVLTAYHFDPAIEGFQSFSKAGNPGYSVFSLEGFPEIRLSFGIDGISVVLMLLTSIVLFAAILASPADDRIKGSSKLFFSCCLLIGAGAMGAFLSTDLFFLYAFHELALIPTFLMIGLFGYGINRVSSAWTITIYLGVGSIILLIGLIAAVIGLDATTFDLNELMAQAKSANLERSTQMWIYLPLLIGFGILVSLFPFHTWAPNAYADAPTPVAMLHAGVLKKFGLYGLIRVANPLFPEGADALQTVVLILLLGNIIILGFVTIAQKRLDKMLGYSSVMHMGYVFLGIASGTTIGMIGAVLLMFAHGVSIALSFALTGYLRERYGTLEFSQFGGIAKIVPSLGLIFGFAAFASIGLPGFTNFAAEVLVFFGGFKDFNGSFSLLQWATVLALWGVVISAVYMLRAFRSMFKGDLKQPTANVQDLSLAEKVPVLLLLATLLVTGFMPGLLIDYIKPALEGIMIATNSAG